MSIISPVSNDTGQTATSAPVQTQSAGESFGGEWLLADSDTGQTMLSFTSFIEAAVKRSGSVAYDAVEKGSFAAYNKTTDPLNAIITLAITGTKAEMQNAIDVLANLQANTVTFSFVSPVKEFENLTLESFSWKWERTQGADVLYVELALVEIREVETLYTDTVVTPSASGAISAGDTKNPSNASPVDTGMTNTQEPSNEEKKVAESGLHVVGGVLWG